MRPEIPWKQISGLRDLLTHEYFRIAMSDIDKIVERDLSPLEVAVEAMLEPSISKILEELREDRL